MYSFEKPTFSPFLKSHMMTSSQAPAATSGPFELGTSSTTIPGHVLAITLHVPDAT